MLESEKLKPKRTDLCCRVCGAPNAQLHYRGVVCGSCKVFFVRCCQRLNGVPECSREGKCSQLKGMKGCRGCRYESCKKVGMWKADVGRFLNQEKVRPIKMEGPDAQPPENLAVVGYFTVQERMEQIIEITQSMSIGFHFINVLNKEHLRPQDFARQLVGIEKLCDNDDAPFTSEFSHRLDIPFAQVLRESQRCCERTPIRWNGPIYEVATMNPTIREVYCRSVTLFADFVSACPELYMLGETDRVRLAAGNFCNVVLLTMLYNGYRKKARGLLFPLGQCYVPEAQPDRSEFDRFLNELVYLLHTQILPVFIELDICKEEYCILKMISLFATFVPLSEQSQRVVRRARCRYTAMLKEFVIHSRPGDSPEQLSHRISRLASIMQHLVHASEMDNQMCARMITSHQVGFHGDLSYDIHVRNH